MAEGLYSAPRTLSALITLWRQRGSYLKHCPSLGYIHFLQSWEFRVEPEHFQPFDLFLTSSPGRTWS